MNFDPVLQKSFEGITELDLETQEAEELFWELLEFAKDLMLADPHIDSSQAISQTFEVNYRGISLQGSERVSKAIEAFGKELIEQAFLCLGEHGPYLVEEYRKCKSVEEKVFVCQMLDTLIDRLSRIATHQFTDEDDESFQYSPVRLSPKLLGTYPNMNLKPTCLAKSLLATSFFIKADIPVLHAGVMVPDSHADILFQAAAIENALDEASRLDIDPRPKDAEGLQIVAEDNIASATQSRGFHAAVYAKLDESCWLQFDPNFGSGIGKQENASMLNEALDSLSSTKEPTDSRKELEMIFGSNETIFILLIKKLSEALPSYGMLKHILKETPTEEVYSEIIEKIFKPMLPTHLGGTADDRYKEIHAQISHMFPLATEKNFQAIQIILTGLIEEHVFGEKLHDETWLSSIERCKKDAAFLERRVQDLQFAPILFLLKLQSIWLQSKSKQRAKRHLNPLHPQVEVALPYYRIGICVLSDVASYYGSELPLSAWLTYWPSDVSLAEHRKRTPSHAQRLLAKKAIEAINNGPLTYLTLSAIVNKDD